MADVVMQDELSAAHVPFVDIPERESIHVTEQEKERLYNFFQPLDTAARNKAIKHGQKIIRDASCPRLECLVCTRDFRSNEGLTVKGSVLKTFLESLPGNRGEKWTTLKREVMICEACCHCLKSNEIPKMHRYHDRHPGITPAALRGMTFLERALVARSIPAGMFIKLSSPFHIPEAQHDGLAGNICVLPSNSNICWESLPPRFPDLSPFITVIVDKKSNAQNWRGFRVRRHKILNALQWLKQNNPYYRDIEIDTTAVCELPEDDFIDLTRYDVAVAEEDITVGKTISGDRVVPSDECLLQPDVINTQNLGYAILHGIPETAKPYSEFGCGQLLAHLFPCEFPYGKGMPEEDKAQSPEVFQERCQELLQLNARSACSNTTLLFVLYDILRKRIVNNTVKLFVHIRPDEFREGATAEEIGNAIFDKKPSSASTRKALFGIDLALKGLPHTQSHKALVRDKFVSSLIEWGTPLFWFTFNPADLYTKLPMTICKRDITSDLNNVQERSKILVSRPDAVSENFDIIEQSIFSGAFGRGGLLGEQITPFSCYEIQGRGAVHSHSLLFPPKDFPQDAFYELVKQDEKFRDLLCRYWDSLVDSNIIACEQCGSQIPCKHLDETKATFWALKSPELDTNRHNRPREAHAHAAFASDAARRCQYHTCGRVCNNPRLPKDQCRFGFPRPVRQESKWEHKDGQWHFLARQSHEHFNPFVSILLLIIRCNHDIRILCEPGSQECVFWYQLKYMSKTYENDSAVVAAVQKAAAIDADLERQGTPSHKRAARTLCIFANKLASSTSVSAPEVYRYLMGKQDYRSLHQDYRRSPFWAIYNCLFPDESRQATATLELSSKGAHYKKTSPLSPYLNRKGCDESLSFYEYHAKKGLALDSQASRWSQTSKAGGKNGIPLFPFSLLYKVSKLSEGELRWFCYHVFLPFKEIQPNEDPFALEGELSRHTRESDTGIDATRLFKNVRKAIRSFAMADQLPDAAREVVDNTIREPDDHWIPLDMEREEQDLLEWDELTSRLDEGIEETDGYPTRDLPPKIAHAVSSLANINTWGRPTPTSNVVAPEEPVQQLEPADDATNEMTFLQRISDSKRAVEMCARLLEEVHEGVTFTNSQKGAVNALMLAACRLLPRPERVPASFILSGPAGTGKSFVLERFIAAARRRLGHDAVAVTAHVASAAKRVGGQTLMSLLHISHNRMAGAYSEKLRATLQNELRDLEILVIDEYSIVGATLLHKVDMALRIAKSKPDTAFGDVLLIFAGDMYQLPAVKDTSLFAFNTTKRIPSTISTAARAGLLLWRQIPFTWILKEPVRTEDNMLWDALSEFRCGSGREILSRLLEARDVTKREVLEQYKRAQNVKILAFTRDMVEALNTNLARTMSKDTNAELIPAKAIDTKMGMAAQDPRIRRLKLTECQNLPNDLSLFIGMPVMVTVNGSTRDPNRYINGMEGEVKRFVFSGDRSPTVVKVVIQDQDGHVREIPRIQRTIKALHNPSYQFDRSQFPLTAAFAATIHKAQGLTLENICICLGDIAGDQAFSLLYVALTRVKQSQNLFILKGPGEPKLSFSPPRMFKREAELQEKIENDTRAACFSILMKLYPLDNYHLPFAITP